MGKTGQHTGASERVMRFLSERANTEVTYTEIQHALGYPRFTVTNSINHLISKTVPLHKPSAGIVIFRPNSHNRQTDQPKENLGSAAYYAALKRDVKLYEFVGKSGGRTIVRGEDDELYILSPLFTEDIPNGN